MRPSRLSVLAGLLLLCPALGKALQSTSLETAVIPSGKLRLKGFLWRPALSGPSPAVLFVHGSGSTDAAHTSGFAITEAAQRRAPVFLKHGYAFLYLFRRGQGLSADQAPFMQEFLQHEKATKEDEARGAIALCFADD
jgi:hypothetical protein